MNFKIATLPGDGIGPEIVDQAVKVLNAVGKKFSHSFDFTHAPVGAAAIDATGNPYPDETHKICMDADAVLFGAIGDPKFDNNPKATVRPEQGLLAMRKQLGLDRDRYKNRQAGCGTVPRFLILWPSPGPMALAMNTCQSIFA